jgi:glycosyltransferase involved in cell wall biosynthesis
MTASKYIPEEYPTRKFISITTGTFNEVDNIEEWADRVQAAMETVPGFDFEMIVIDNASTDGTPEVLRRLAAKRRNFKVILNARNFGHIRSPYYAILQATGSAVICLASDLQDPPEMIPALIEQWSKGFPAVVCVKNKTQESFIFSSIRRFYYRAVQRLADIAIIENFTGFGLYDKVIVDYCRKIESPYPYFRGIISEIGLPTAQLYFNKPARQRGFTKNNFYTLYDIAMLGFTNHSKVPLRLAAMLGFLMAILSFLVACIYSVYKLLYWNDFSVGIAPLVIGIFLFSSVQLFFIGVLGEYIGAIHTQVLKRPLVVERERINF